MNRQKIILTVLAVAMIGGAAGFLARVKGNQKLGNPGVKTTPLPDSQNLLVALPEQVPGFRSEAVEIDDLVIQTLPADTSYGQRRYQAEDGFGVLVNVVLMGSDRTSLHKPQFCLIGSGWSIDNTETVQIPMARPVKYDLQMMKLTTTKEIVYQGKPLSVRGLYLYWFVADDALTAHHWDRMWQMGKHLLTRGELQRWAYITYFSTCLPGQEEAAYERMKEFVAASVPEFQRVPGAVGPLASQETD